jgi:hypothetical protein
MSDTQELCDLIETRSAQHCIVRRKLWEWAFTAILDGRLTFELPNDLMPDPQFDHAARLRTLIIGALPAIEYGADPSKWNWSRMLMISPAVFDKWLKAVLRNRQFTARPKRRAGTKSTKREAVRNFIEKRKSLLRGATHKEIAKHVKDKLGVDVSERTVRRALGRK